MKMIWACGPTTHDAIDHAGVEIDTNYANVLPGTLCPRWEETHGHITDWTPVDFAEFVNACIHETPGTYPVVGPEFDGWLSVDCENADPDDKWGHEFYQLWTWVLRERFPRAKIALYGWPQQASGSWDYSEWASGLRRENDERRWLYRLWDGIVCSSYISATESAPLATVARRLRQNTLEACRIAASFDVPKTVLAWTMYRRAGMPYAREAMSPDELRAVVAIPQGYGCLTVLNDWSRSDDDPTWEPTFERELGKAMAVWGAMR